VPIEAIEVEVAAASVYNFAVEPAHNYTVGNAGVLVHNNCAQGLGPSTAAERVGGQVQEWLGEGAVENRRTREGL
jgi:hypothetical protein